MAGSVISALDKVCYVCVTHFEGQGWCCSWISCLVEKLSVRCILVLRESLHTQRIFKSLLHLGPTLEVFGYFQRIFKTNIKVYKYRNIYMLNNCM